MTTKPLTLGHRASVKKKTKKKDSYFPGKENLMDRKKSKLIGVLHCLFSIENQLVLPDTENKQKARFHKCQLLVCVSE